MEICKQVRYTQALQSAGNNIETVSLPKYIITTVVVVVVVVVVVIVVIVVVVVIYYIITLTLC